MVVAMSGFLLLVDWMVVQEGILLRIACSIAIQRASDGFLLDGFLLAGVFSQFLDNRKTKHQPSYIGWLVNYGWSLCRMVAVKLLLRNFSQRRVEL